MVGEGGREPSFWVDTYTHTQYHMVPSPSSFLMSEEVRAPGLGKEDPREFHFLFPLRATINQELSRVWP